MTEGGGDERGDECATEGRGIGGEERAAGAPGEDGDDHADGADGEDEIGGDGAGGGGACERVVVGLTLGGCA